MQITTYKCDVCGAEIQGSRISILIASLDERGEVTESKCTGLEARSLGFDACLGCADKLAERIVLTQPCEVIAEEDAQSDVDPEEEKKDPEPAKPSGGRKALDFDLGKAISLRRGGWTLTKIADEMKCAPQTVANYLERAGVIKKKENVNASNTADV